MVEQTKSQKFKLGLFVIVSTTLLISALYFIGNKQNIFSSTFRVTATFNDVNGLMLGNNVRFSGINVGTVKNIKMISDTAICVDLEIETDILMHLKKNVLATINSDGLVGSMVVNIIPVNKSAAPLEHGDTIVSIRKISTNEMLATLNQTNANASLLTLDLLKITNSINSGKGTFDMLISDEAMAGDLKTTIANLKMASVNAAKTINDLNGIIASVNYDESLAAVLLSDPKSASKMQNTITHLEKSSQGIDSVIRNLQNVVYEIKNGKGTLNYFIYDTETPETIDSTLHSIKESSEKLNENLEALKHNILFRRYFKNLEK
jgi:phospholipid/cholesterol/gamma-HCH transport system substrate-binding protein